jgi:hypothetical protein
MIKPLVFGTRSTNIESPFSNTEALNAKKEFDANRRNVKGLLQVYTLGSDLIMRFQPTSNGFTAVKNAQNCATDYPSLTILVCS